ncbi:hypothetical protein [Streptosporangium sandarakinum]|uniref:hypothetical protein n=1 Tax=Streptosporangium sandarakinum TaxID=1260955 RepID=UPI003792EE21
MVTPNSEDATATSVRPKGQRPVRGLAALGVAGSLVAAVAAIAQPSSGAAPASAAHLRPSVSPGPRVSGHAQGRGAGADDPGAPRGLRNDRRPGHGSAHGNGAHGNGAHGSGARANDAHANGARANGAHGNRARANGARANGARANDGSAALGPVHKPVSPTKRFVTPGKRGGFIKLGFAPEPTEVRQPTPAPTPTVTTTVTATPTPSVSETPSATPSAAATPSASASASASATATSFAVSRSVVSPSPRPGRPHLRRGWDDICRPRFLFRIDQFHPRNFFLARTHFIDGPGGSVTATVTRQHRVYYEVEFEREKIQHRLRALEITRGPRLDREEVLRLIRNNLNPLIAEEYIVEAGHEYTHEISDDMYGHLWYRVFGYRVGFSAWFRTSTCRFHKVVAGIANVPARVEGWKYWETSRPVFHGHVLWDCHTKGCRRGIDP